MNLNPGQRGIECSPTVFEGRRNANKIPASPKRMKSQRIVNFGFNGFGADNVNVHRAAAKLLFPKAARPAAPCATYCYHAICGLPLGHAGPPAFRHSTANASWSDSTKSIAPFPLSHSGWSVNPWSSFLHADWQAQNKLSPNCQI